MSNKEMSEKPDWVSPPGHTIISIIEERELTLEQFANNIGRSINIAQKILDGTHIIDQDLARQLARTLGASESFWLAREYDYRSYVSPPRNTQINNLTELLAKLPINDMQKFGWIEKTRSVEDKVSECLAFFGVSSLAQWQGRYEHAFLQAAYRSSATHPSCEVSTSAWLRQGELETQGDEVATWSPEVLAHYISNFRRLTWYKSPDLFLPKLKELLSHAGVKFAIVRTPKGCSASGAVRILSDGTPHIQLSFRYLSDDQFWFTLFHEIAHLILHFDKMPFFENSHQGEEKYELEANEFATKVIVPMQYREELLSLGGSRFPIIGFAKKIGIAPGLVVGQLQHEGIIGFNQMQHLKRRYRWAN